MKKLLFMKIGSFIFGNGNYSTVLIQKWRTNFISQITNKQFSNQKIVKILIIRVTVHAKSMYSISTKSPYY